MLITFEGIDGSGKSTVSKSVYAYLLSKGVDAVCYALPYYNRDMISLCSEHHYNNFSEMMAFVLDLSLFTDNVLKSSLQSNKVVFCDRFTDSTKAYQIGGRELEQNMVNSLCDKAVEGIVPDITFYINTKIDIALSRTSSDRFSNLDHDFYERVVDYYNYLAQVDDNRIVVIDGNGDKQSVFCEVVSKLSSFLGL